MAARNEHPAGDELDGAACVDDAGERDAGHNKTRPRRRWARHPPTMDLPPKAFSVGEGFTEPVVQHENAVSPVGTGRPNCGAKIRASCTHDEREAKHGPKTPGFHPQTRPTTHRHGGSARPPHWGPRPPEHQTRRNTQSTKTARLPRGRQAAAAQDPVASAEHDEQVGQSHQLADEALFPDSDRRA